MNVLIGKRELFAFAERYSECRIKEYAELADGAILCSLFAAVFPNMRIRTATSQTHTRSQLAHANWSALRKALSAVGIPPSLLNRERLQCGDAESGFSALVLFYFLFHLSRRSDFSAEFAADVSEELTEFLQSVDSIAALVAGGAMSLSAVPLPLQEQLQGAIMRTREGCGLPEGGKERGRSCGDTGLDTACPSSVVLAVQMDGGDNENNEKTTSDDLKRPPSFSSPEKFAERKDDRVPQETGGNEREVHSGYSVCRKWKQDERECEEAYDTIDHCDSCRGGDAGYRRMAAGVAEEVGDELVAPIFQQNRDLQELLMVKEKKCEELKAQNLELLGHLTKLRIQYSMEKALPWQGDDTANESTKVEKGELLASEEVQHLRSVLQTTRSERRRLAAKDGVPIDELLGGIVDAETGEVIDVENEATLLNGVLADVLRDIPSDRREAQRCLWRIVSAFNVLEERLAVAVGTQKPNCERVKRETNTIFGDDGGECGSPASVFRPPTTPCTTAKLVESCDDSSMFDLKAPADLSLSPQNIFSRLKEEMILRQRRFERQLIQLHDNEARLQKRIHVLQNKICHLYQRSLERDLTWKSLCAAICEAERTSLLVADAESEEAVERLLEQRNACYIRADEVSASLMRDQEEQGDALIMPGGHENDCHDVCETMKVLLESVTQDRDKLLKELEALQDVGETGRNQRTEHQQRLSKGDLRKSVRTLLQEEGHSSNGEWFAQTSTFFPFASSPSKLVLKNSVSAAQQEDGRPLHGGRCPLPPGENLSALLSLPGVIGR